MEMLHERCAGLDVHKNEIVACARVVERGRVRSEVARFATTTRGLLELAGWLEDKGATHAAMEATGVYWKPVWHILEGHLELVLVNPQHVKNVPGRKSDVNDATWIAELLAHGLVTASFVPPRPIRELRDLTRTRTQLVREIVQHRNRIEKVLEDANIKLASCLSDLLGASGRRMLKAIVRGESDAAAIVKEASRRLKCPRSDLMEALSGRLGAHHRFLIGMHLDMIEGMEAGVSRIEMGIEEQIGPFRDRVELVKGVPGFGQGRAAVALIGEIGVDMSAFPTAGHLLSWARVVPRLDESAGRKRSRRIKKGGTWLKPLLIQAARSAVRKKGSYFSALYGRLARRIGDKKAIVAVAAALLTTIYHMLKDGTEFADLGASHFVAREQDKEATARRYARRLRDLGYEVELRAVA